MPQGSASARDDAPGFAFADALRLGELDPSGALGPAGLQTVWQAARIAFVSWLLDDLAPHDPEHPMLVVVECNTRHHRAPGFREHVLTTIAVADVGRSSFRIDYETQDGEQRLVATGDSTIVHVDRAGARSAPLPARLRTALVEGRSLTGSQIPASVSTKGTSYR